MIGLNRHNLNLHQIGIKIKNKSMIKKGKITAWLPGFAPHEIADSRAGECY